LVSRISPFSPRFEYCNFTYSVKGNNSPRKNGFDFWSVAELISPQIAWRQKKNFFAGLSLIFLPRFPYHFPYSNRKFITQSGDEGSLGVSQQLAGPWVLSSRSCSYR